MRSRNRIRSRSRSRSRTGSRTGRLGAALVIMTLAALGVAACAGGGGDDDGTGVASVSKQTTTTAAAASAGRTDPQDAAVDFAKCMREHGVDMPDPQVGDNGTFTFGGGNVDIGSPKVREAEKACRPKLRAGGFGAGRDDPAVQASALDFARCMRANGIENFPTPTAATC